MNILNIIFEARSEQIAKLTETDKAYISSHCIFSKTYNNLENLVTEYCPDNASDILSAIDYFISELNFESSYFYLISSCISKCFK